ncbi:unnamed protein product [Orchesella dallaii]|uniref:Uncharacterized protein n=1 Tax=Orchesella dallaii TaxID=48710 RepID=A0ABP1R2M5_9HEXA
MPVVALAWAANQNLCHFTRLWLTTLLHCLKLCAVATKKRLKCVNGNVNEKGVKEILKSFVELESVVASYNEAFGWQNAIDVLSLIVGIVITLFQMIYFCQRVYSSFERNFFAVLGEQYTTNGSQRVCFSFERNSFGVPEERYSTNGSKSA